MSEAYVCPQCGADQWVADYSAAVTQTVDKLVRLPDGSFDATYSEPAVIVEEPYSRLALLGLRPRRIYGLH